MMCPSGEQAGKDTSMITDRTVLRIGEAAQLNRGGDREAARRTPSAPSATTSTRD
jgi:hypothetical protein